MKVIHELVNIIGCNGCCRLYYNHNDVAAAVDDGAGVLKLKPFHIIIPQQYKVLIYCTEHPLRIAVGLQFMDAIYQQQKYSFKSFFPFEPSTAAMIGDEFIHDSERRGIHHNHKSLLTIRKGEEE